MEKLNQKTLSFPTKMLSKVLTVFTVLVLAACGNKDSGGGTTNTLNGLNVSNCTSCSSIANPIGLDTVVSQLTNGSLALRMQLFLNGNQYYPGSSSSYNLYNGPVAFQGQMIAATVLYGQSSCTLPAGTYDLRTTNVGSMGSAGVIPSIELLATGPANVVVQLYQGMLINQNGQIRYTGNIYIRNVNGQDCGYGFSSPIN